MDQTVKLNEISIIGIVEKNINFRISTNGIGVK